MANDNKVQVEFGASTEGLDAGAKAAANAVKTSTAEMQAAMVSLNESALAMKEGIGGALSSINSGFAACSGVLMGFTAALAGGSAIKEFVKDAVKLTAEAAGMGKAMGISATEASYLRAALADVGLSSDAALTAANKITLALVKNEEAFSSLGVATRDQNGNFRSTSDVMQDTNEKLKKFGEGTDRNVEGMKIYGRAWADIAPLVNKFSGVSEQAREDARALNLVVGQESVDAMAAYKKANNGVSEVLEGFKNTIGQALMPILTDLAEWFKSIGPTAIKITQIAVGTLATAFNLLDTVVYSVWEVVKSFIQTLTIGLATVATVIEKLLNRDFTGAKAAWKAGGEAISDSWSENMKKVNDKAEETAARITRLFSGDQKESKTPNEGLHSEGGKKKDDVGGDKNQISKMRDELTQKKEIEAYYFRDSIQMELEFWQSKKGLAKNTESDEAAITSAIYQLHKKEAQDTRAEKIASIDADKAIGAQGIAFEREVIASKKSMRELNEVEAANAMKAINAKEYALDIEALERKKAIYGEESKEAIKLQGEIDAVKQKSRTAMLKDETQISLAVAKTWEEAFKPISAGFEKAVTGVIQGTTSIQKAIKNMAQSVLLEFVNMGVKSVVSWAATEAAKTTATATGTATRTGLEVTAASTSVAITAATAIKNILSYAWTAMAGAFSAMAAIPIVGPFLAIGAGAAAFAAVSGIVGSISSARGGYDIPAGVNPITQLHEREMVLPAAQADAVRQMADGGTSAGGGVTLNVSALDGHSVARLFRDNGAHIVAALRQQQRNFAF